VPSLANQAHDIISTMQEAKRNETLSRFMSKSGESCKVTQSFFQGVDSKKSAFWNVACTSKKAYVIMMNNDSSGSTKILDCKAMKAVAKTDCFKKF
jgi:mitochondrial fission protein ELM1